MTIFDIINNISQDTDMLFSREEIEEFYNPYIVIDYFSNFEDSILIANEINCFHKQPTSKYEHYIYLHGLIRKRKRTHRYPKKNINEESDVKAIMEYYDYGREKAREVLQIISNINIEDIKKYLYNNKGGVEK